LSGTSLQAICHTWLNQLKETTMAENKTVQTDQSVQKFLKGVADKEKRLDCQTLVALMQKVTGEPPRMWGSSIVGFGSYHYKYESGREGDMPLVGFSPRKQNLTLYLMGVFEEHEQLMNKLGKYTTGKGCLYVKRLEDVDMPALEKLVKGAVKSMRKKK
jgi:hypothetical protein